MYIFLAAVIIILLMIFIFTINTKEFHKIKRNLKFAISLPGPSILLCFINLLQIAWNYTELINYVETMTQKYGHLSHLILGKNIFVVLTKPDDYKLVLTNVNGNYKSSVTETWETLLGDGIIRASGASHRLRRKIIQPLLNSKHLSKYVTFFDSCSNYCVNTLERHVDGSIFNLKPYITQYSFNIFLVTMIGIQGTAHKDEYDELLYWQEKLIKDAYNRIIKPWLQLEWIFSLTKDRKQMSIGRKIELDFISRILPRKMANHTALQNNNEIFRKSQAIFNNYWNRVEQVYNNVTSKSCKVSNENFLDDIRSFYSAIQNTITEITSFIILILAMHGEVQEKLREEISITFNNDKIDAQSLFRMRYFHMVFQETLRLFPITPIIFRQLTGDIKLESCTLPDGCYVMIPIFAIHRNPAYWQKPLKFIPERFLSESSSSRHRYTYIPFGTGLRDCLGQRYAFLSVATIIVNLVRRFRFATTISNVDDIKLTTDIILRSRDVKWSIFRV